MEFPTAEQQALHWWLVNGSEIIKRGRDPDPIAAAGIPAVSMEEQTILSMADYKQIALVPSTHSTVRWHDLSGGITEKQALAAAMIDAKSRSLNSDILHFAATVDEGGQIITSAIERGLMASGLAHLKSLHIDPDIITPSGFLISFDSEHIIQADLGFEKILRAKQLIAPAEPALIDQLAGQGDIHNLDNTIVDVALVDTPSQRLVNFRSGLFAKKTRATVSARQKRILAGMIAALLLISLAIPIVQWIRYARAADAADEAALVAAKTELGQVANIEEAERRLDEQMTNESRGNRIYSAPSSALFSAVQMAPAVAVDRLGYRQDGTLSARLSASRNEEINPVLIALQQNGFQLTATPTTDATGMAKADITLRAP
ncbi:hypothetical protein HF685_14840 [Parasphingorhabdus halotolerans]|uniref:General secretion pathway protein L n=1 Tax=Parasphingorhabdus halotolerans TaxID=2725558 RepID=A0A6H2DQX5_9SPHN|nr:hypothetical protein HF685_14840 [Parasphingorhabdus halotolerans]